MTMLVKKRDNFFDGFPSFFDDFFTKDIFHRPSINLSKLGTTMPAVNVSETEQALLVDVAVPGLNKEDIQVEFHQNVLTISSESKQEDETKDDDNTFTRKEFSYQSFRRSFTVAENLVDGDKIEARYENGVLHIVLPKMETKQIEPNRTIKIN